ncbi:hypothetical protein [Bradyrhizobium manausense]|uniref:hypothetical protein n=1 Tax=Bradyrhizobium manausense TaxID=989370 RepID=UPI001BAAF73A|nr:hypothetical protein [Bradyrhizobium manausense]MBR0721784.1 hypothetical protein [Bradyrhizobium manausense]
MEKSCIACQRRLPLECFYKHPDTADGRLGKCKDCQKANVKAARERNPAHYRAYEQRRAKLDHRIAAAKAYAAANPDVIKRLQAKSNTLHFINREARIILGNAVRDGRIARPFRCEVCQQAVPMKTLHGHHEDYTKPLWAAWCCSRCHRNIHKGVVTLGLFHELRKTA